MPWLASQKEKRKMKVWKSVCLFLVLANLIGCGGGGVSGVKDKQSIDQPDNGWRQAVLEKMTPEVWAGAVAALPEIEAAYPDGKPEEIGGILWNQICLLVDNHPRS